MYKANKRFGTGIFTLKDKNILKANFTKGKPTGEAIYKKENDEGDRKEIFFDDSGLRKWTEREVLRK